MLQPANKPKAVNEYLDRLAPQLRATLLSSAGKVPSVAVDNDEADSSAELDRLYPRA